MTTPNGAIVFNASTGSDSAASGLGPATAVTGSGASTDGTAVVTGITTTGVSAGDLLWVQTASGRQFSIIASVDSGTQVTCDDTFALGSGQTWAIGGKRATWDNSDSRQLFLDAQPGYIIETETDQTLTTSSLDTTGIDGTAYAPIVFRGDSATTQRVITQTANAACIGQETAYSYIVFENLKFENSNGTKTSADGLVIRSAFCTIKNCTFGDATNTLRYGVSSRYDFNLYIVHDTVFQNMTGAAVWMNAGAGNRGCGFYNCTFKGNNSSSGSYCVEATNSSFMNCIFDSNSQSCILVRSREFALPTIVNNVFYGSGAAGVIVDGSGDGGFLNISRNIFEGNGTYGISLTSATNDDGRSIDGNAFYNNTSGQVLNCSNDNAITLTASPFTNAASGDFTINTTSGGGADLRTAAVTLGSTETRPFRWLDTSTGGGSSTPAAAVRHTRLK